MHICGKGGADRKGVCPACDAWLEREAHKRRTTRTYDAGHSPAEPEEQAPDTDRQPALGKTLEELEKRAEIISICDLLGPNARSILLAVARRLDIGREHGDFTGSYDWIKEGNEELLDFIVYEVVRRMRLH